MASASIPSRRRQQTTRTGLMIETNDRRSTTMASTREHRWRGVNHLALITQDMDATVRFYVGVLGMRLVATIGTPEFRHYFFELGQGNTIAFFEYADAPSQPFSKPAGIPDARAAQFDHVAFDLVDEEALEDLRTSLREAGADITRVVDHGFLRSVYFTDPNGIALEASYWVTDPTGHADLSFDDERLFADPDPVPAVDELSGAGRLDRVPGTRLVDAPTSRIDDWSAPTTRGS
jgi:catechol 2,3-dioxygenase-like lactoylglutathione lyase family enzyme